MTDEASLSEEVARAARVMQGEVGSRADTLDAVVRLGLEMVRSAEHCGVTLAHGTERVETPAASDGVPHRVDELQLEHGSGPCLDAVRMHEVVHSPDLEQDDRWPEWGPRVVEETGVRSMLCFRLFTNEDTLGALNFYARSPDAFDGADHDSGLALAAHAAIAVSSAAELEDLRAAVGARTAVAQAQGILMERFSIPAQHALRVLARVAVKRDLKLREVAEALIRTTETRED